MPLLILAFVATFRASILAPLANPNVALLVLFAGILLVYIEFHRPGIVFPGSVGTVLILIAIYAFNQMPIRPVALLLILSAFTLIILELKFASYGLFTAAGIAALTLGTLNLIDSPAPELRIHPAIALALCTSFGLLTAILLRLALRARHQKTLIGPAALVGYPAIAMEPLHPASMLPAGAAREERPIGHILVQGEIWQATAPTPIAEKAAVRVTGHHGDILEVEIAP